MWEATEIAADDGDGELFTLLTRSKNDGENGTFGGWKGYTVH